MRKLYRSLAPQIKGTPYDIEHESWDHDEENLIDISSEVFAEAEQALDASYLGGMTRTKIAELLREYGFEEVK